MTQSKEELAELLNQALKNGELIITPNDPRKHMLDLVSGQAMNRATFVIKIQNGEYGGYTIANIDNIPTPMSKPDHRSDNNLG